MGRKSKKERTDSSAGYVYVATNALIPGLVKVGHTLGPVKDRMKGLYSTGVPGPFQTDGVRFFVDCQASEAVMHETLARVAKRCPNREFFVIEKSLAVQALDDLYKTQHIRTHQYIFEWGVEVAFVKSLSMENVLLAQQTFEVLSVLPQERRKVVELTLLAGAMSLRAEQVSIWLVRNREVDPEEPIKNPPITMDTRQYDLTAFEYSILLDLTRFETYLLRIGCDISKSIALCLVIDVLINGPGHYEFKERFGQFAIKLIHRGANVHERLNVDLFAEAPKKSRSLVPFRFDLFPRNSNMSCYEIASHLAPHCPWFAKLHEAMANSVQP